MGVPALFRWLSKKYPKIVLPVVEEEESQLPNGDGTSITIPVDISKPNPNGTEFDNLYLDMNGIVHPCTHPDGKPAPETEEDMMVEIFNYTERVVNMIRPRKLLFMAIDGVAPRAKMNQQRSRRFRSAQEAKEKEEARKEAVAMFEALGQTVSEETKTQKAWDSNAITPGTPFMDLLASCLRYWVTDKINSDPGWKNLQVILSDASVPGEGEHKIMDFIRRQRTNPQHDPNTRHVIYGLDADLIMLALATHEPHFRVLREDVFFQEGSRTACRICGQEGHYAAQCTGEAKPKQDQHDVVKKEPEKKPFIFLDVSILREYLEVELNAPQAPFAFDLERALDDWVLLIFFVGNDFLPHLPSLEIREGAIDTLLKIWKEELFRMGGYLTNHGHIELPRLEIILEGLARREDDIFRRRREAEERQDQNAKRRKIEENGQADGKKEVEGGMRMSETTYVPVEVKNEPPIHPSLPNRPAFNMAPPPLALAQTQAPAQVPASGTNPPQINLTTNHDVVANRRALRLANMSAAELLKTELATRAAQKQSRSGMGRGLSRPQSSFGPLRPDETVVVPRVKPTETDVLVEPPPLPPPSAGPMTGYSDYANMDVLPGLGGPLATGWGTPMDNERGIGAPSVLEPPSIGSVGENQPHSDAGSKSDSGGGVVSPAPPDLVPATGLEDAPKEESADADADADAEGDADEDDSMDTNVSANGAEVDPNAAVASMADVMNTLTSAEESLRPHGVKRKLEEAEAEEEGSGVDEEDDEGPPDVIGAVVPRKVHPDGTVEQEDTVRLWEPGYKERYYKQKFGVELSDMEFRKKITKCYVEGLSWVLHYYYQGTPSWQWYYPYHYAPFASDFEDVSKMDIKFEIGQPFKSFEQLMGVFPAASRQHIPKPFHDLMVEEDSPIIDFYPTTFEIDMNGKKMAWQGVALLPFIDEKRLLDAMSPRLSKLTDEEVRRNKWGSNVLFVGKDHPLHPFLSGLYVKRKNNDAITLDTRLSEGIAGSTLPDSQCIPDSTYFSPFVERDMPDIPDNKSISALYYYPRQLKLHRSQLLPGVKKPMRVLTSADFETLHRRGGGGRGRGRGGGMSDNHGTGYGVYGAGRGGSYSQQQPYGGAGGYDRNTGYGYGYGYGSYGNHAGTGGYSASHHNYHDSYHSSNGTMGGRGGYSGSNQSSSYGHSHGHGRGYGQQSHPNYGTYGHNSSNTRGRDRGGHY